MTNNDLTQSRLDALNHWLGDVYGEETSLDALLVGAGLSGAEAEKIHRLHLTAFLQVVGHHLDRENEGRHRVIVWHYGLVDGQPQDFYVIGPKVGVCGNRIRQLVHQRLAFYREPGQQAQLEVDLVTIARHLL